MVSNLYVDIRLKIKPEKRHNLYVSDDLERGLAIGDAVCNDIRELEHYPDLYSVELIKIGKINNIEVSINEDLLLEDNE